MSVALVRMDLPIGPDNEWAVNEDLNLVQLVGGLSTGFVLDGNHVVTLAKEAFRGCDGIKMSVGNRTGTYSVWFATDARTVA